MDDIRYGFYLRPSAAMCRAQAEVHALLARQYGLQVAGRFMPHATIKGFFQSTVGADQLITALDAAMSDQTAFLVHNRGPIQLGTSSIVLDVHHTHDGEINAALQAFHDASIGALLPLVHPACAFTAREWLGGSFFAHLTLAMADLRPELAEEVVAFVRDLEPIGPATFVADTFHLFSFTSHDWNGDWWKVFAWDLLHSWRLPHAEQAD